MVYGKTGFSEQHAHTVCNVINAGVVITDGPI